MLTLFLGGRGFRRIGFYECGKSWGKIRSKQAKSDIQSPEETGEFFFIFSFFLLLNTEEDILKIAKNL